jgi:hypothetical protein
MSISNRIALEFPDMYMLWKFAQKLTCKSIEINPPAKSLICDCTEQEINVAIAQYSAKILEGNFASVKSSSQHV